MTTRPGASYEKGCAVGAPSCVVIGAALQTGDSNDPDDCQPYVPITGQVSGVKLSVGGTIAWPAAVSKRGTRMFSLAARVIYDGGTLAFCDSRGRVSPTLRIHLYDKETLLYLYYILFFFSTKKNTYLFYPCPKYTMWTCTHNIEGPARGHNDSYITGCPFL